jgi:hypothetical protein
MAIVETGDQSLPLAKKIFSGDVVLRDAGIIADCNNLSLVDGKCSSLVIQGLIFPGPDPGITDDEVNRFGVERGSGQVTCLTTCNSDEDNATK